MQFFYKKNFNCKIKIDFKQFLNVHTITLISILKTQFLQQRKNLIYYTVPAKMSYQKIYVPSKWLLNFDKYGYEGHVDIK